MWMYNKTEKRRLLSKVIPPVQVGVKIYLFQSHVLSALCFKVHWMVIQIKIWFYLKKIKLGCYTRQVLFFYPGVLRIL